MLRIAIDIGGTFTDVVAQYDDKFSSVKVLTETANPERSALDGVRHILTKISKKASDITGIVHGTTLVTNALIERRGARTAFVTTEGFRDVLEMRHEKRFDQYALNIEFPQPLVPRPLRLTLPERTLADGSIYKPVHTNDIQRLVNTLREESIEAVAIGFLHAYKNAEHESIVAKALAAQLGNEVTICQSAEVAGEIREYERFSTVCANAYVRPLMSRYLDKLLLQLRKDGFSGSFLMMLSDGSLTTLDKAMRFPIRLVEGGPAGGVALAAHVAKEVGSKKLLALDIGGTTAKICFIENGEPKTARRFEIARAWRGMKGSGLPVRVPTVELVEIGAGGGSIVGVDALQRLRVGPRSAGSSPGPAAYDQGGEDATVTDAHIMLGNLIADGFAGGMIELNPARAEAAVAKHIQTPLGFDNGAAAAAGVVELANETLANAARVHAVEQGLDIAGFDLLVSGGGGGLHGARIAEKLGVQQVVVPTNAGVGSAVGFLHSPVAYEIAISVLEPLNSIDTDALSERLAEARKSVHDIVAQAVTDTRIDSVVHAELRYIGQGLELSFPLPDHKDFAPALEQLEHQFREKFQHLYGFLLDDIDIELITLSVKAKERRDDPTPVEYPQEANENTLPTGERTIYSVKENSALTYPELHRDRLGADTLSGPLVVHEAQTTTLVPPGWSLQRVSNGHLLMYRSIA